MMDVKSIGHESVPIELLPTKPDVDIALDIRQRAMEMLTPLCHLIEEAHRHGMHINFNIGPTPHGRIVVSSISIVKELV